MHLVNISPRTDSRAFALSIASSYSLTEILKEKWQTNVTTGSKQTIYDIAKKAGVSASTVGSALNGSWKSRRISETTVQRIQAIADEMNYSVNLQARALRSAKSGLVGMILPQHDNRFFSSVGQCFSNETRSRDALPVIVSTRRERDQELEAVQGLINASVDALMLVGTSHPEILSEVCQKAKVAHVFLDQPCSNAPSVVSENKGGARKLTEVLLAENNPDYSEEVVFLGGNAKLPATAERVVGFKEALLEHGHEPTNYRILACGYQRSAAREALATLYKERQKLPSVMLINSIGCFEGALQFLSQLSNSEVDACAIGAFDFDPFGGLLRHPVPMMRQRAEMMVKRAYQHLDDKDSAPQITYIEPELILPNHLHAS